MIELKRFKKCFLEITNVCNLDCSFCPKTKRSPHFMNRTEFLCALEQIRQYTDYLYLHVMGEPTIHPELSEFLKIAQQYRLKVVLTTNGTQLHQKSLVDMLLHAGALYKIHISLHSFEANASTQSIQDYLTSVTDFAKRAVGETNIIVAFRFWNLDHEIVAGQNQLNQWFFTQLEQAFALDFLIKSRCDFKKDIQLATRTFLQFAERFEWPEISNVTDSQPRFCYGLRDQFAVLCNGTVVPCCLDHEGDIALGNLFDTPLEEILQTPRAKMIYDGFSRRQAVEVLCQTCGYSLRFG